MADTPGPLLGRGRAADVYDVGGGRVLRRYRHARPDATVEREVTVMRHLHAHGYPVPAVYDVDGDDIVMERLDGVTLLTRLERAPWRLGAAATMWADLHHRLAAVPVGDLADTLATRFGAPDCVLHLDFHPDNIMITPSGPVVFDWTNAALGPAGADVAMSWIVAMTSSVDGGRFAQAAVTFMRRRLVDRFVDAAGRAGAVAALGPVAAARLQDPNVRPEERERIRRLVAAWS